MYVRTQTMNKKERFEVFKRDKFTCIYCGRHPPEVVLEVDHIIAKSGGGPDSIDNYATACFDCNRGKSDRPLSVLPPTVAEKIAVVEEKESQYRAYQKLLKAASARLKREVEPIKVIFLDKFPYRDNPFESRSVSRFIEKLGLADVEWAIMNACEKKPYSSNEAWRYFCGTCWRKIRHDPPKWQAKESQNVRQSV